MKPKVYVAGPYTQGDPPTNTKRAMDVGDLILDMGASPFIPHMNHFRHLNRRRSYDFWYEDDLEWLGHCDALFRMDGFSPGADGEVAEAQRLGIPVFYEMPELRKWVSNRD